jgi:MFS family permease
MRTYLREGVIEAPGPGRKVRYKSLFSLSAFHFIDDGFTDSIYMLLPFLAADLHLSFAQVGFLHGVATGAMSLLQVPLALLGERVGDLLVIACGAFGLAGGFILLTGAFSFPSVLLSFFIAKGTNAGQHALVSSVLSHVFEYAGRRAAMGTYNFFGDMGKVSIPFLLALLIKTSGWRHAIFFLSLALLASVPFLWSLSFRNSRACLIQEEGAKGRTARSIRKNRSFSALITLGVIDYSTRAALLTFLPFLLIGKGIPRESVGFALTLIFAGGAAGKFICGIMAEWIGVIPMVIITEALTSAGILSLLLTGVAAIWPVLPLIGIVLNGTSSVLYATVADIIPASGRSRGYGLYYAITLGLGGAAPIAYGFLSDMSGIFVTVAAIGFVTLVTIPLARYLK